jgi:ribulose-5-phosphate 4-epimerase/fuculose-1-phosphate aldolase
MDYLALKERLVQGCRVLAAFDVFDDQGHLSARLPDDAGTALINEFSSPATAGLQQFVPFDVSGEPYPDDAPSETTIHGRVYEAREAVGAVCHNHSPFAVIVSSAGVEMRPVHSAGAVQVDPIPVYEEYEPEGGMLITTDAEGDDVADVLGEGRAMILRGHGAVVAGETVTEAVLASLRLEYNARLLYHQASLGEPWYLPRERLVDMVDTMYSERVMEKSMDYFITESRRS